MTGPIQADRHAQRMKARREAKEAASPWYILGPIPPRPEPTGAAPDVLPTKATIDYYQALPAMYGTTVATTLAAMSVHRVPFTPELLDYLEAKAIRDLRRTMQMGEDKRERYSEARRRAAEDSWVYFIQHDGKVKIGVSINVAARAVSLSLRWTDVVAVIKGDRKLERALHKRFAAYRVGDTEWFDYCDTIREYIDHYAEPFSAQHPAYIKPAPTERSSLTPEVAYRNLANAASGVLLDTQGG